MVVTVTIVIIIMIVTDAKNAIDTPRMIGTGIDIPSGRKRSMPKTKRFLKRRNVEVVVVLKRINTSPRVAVMKKVLTSLVVIKVDQTLVSTTVASKQTY